jgi:hypothetical protein
MQTRANGRLALSVCSELSMDEIVESLILDLLEWIGPSPRPYAEVLDAWRTSCPRLPVWEEAHDRGLIKRDLASGSGFITVSEAGRRHLSSHRLMPASPPEPKRLARV